MNKFTEEKLEKTFTELLWQKRFVKFSVQ